MNKIPTSQLVEFLIQHKGKFVEASMSNGIFKATHILRFGGRKIFDTGIDSQEVTWTPQEFIDFYPKAYWMIEQVV
ncbi:MAG: hypothetical protein JXM69_06370 [Anaerolineae bacterium]|nr:hypothetical protein [Anaerolineae bacterium]